MSDNPLVQEIEAAYAPLRHAVEGLAADGLDRVTPAGWTVKEMVAHVAFWQEAVRPVVETMLREGDPPEGGYAFGSGYRPEGEWPDADTHNAREAAWARERPAEAVLDRLDRAHTDLLVVAASVSDDERLDHAGYFAGVVAHFREHLAELGSMPPRPR
jgi:hypothetical protein